MTHPIVGRDLPEPDRLYEETVASFGAALSRLARAYELDPHLREDLTQEIHLALWRSFSQFDGKCSLRTWVYRIAHNTAATHMVKDRNRRWRQLVSLDEIGALPDGDDVAAEAERRLEREELAALVRQLKPLDRQIMVLYLEGLDAAAIAEITGLSSANIAVKVHRVKKILVERASQGRNHARCLRSERPQDRLARRTHGGSANVSHYAPCEARQHHRCFDQKTSGNEYRPDVQRRAVSLARLCLHHSAVATR